MRDIEEYTQKYLEPDFEQYQVKYRRKKVLEILNHYKPERVLEIGCGMEPLFQYADWNYQLWAVVEPSNIFCENAQQIVTDGKIGNRVQVFRDFFPTAKIGGMHFDFIVCSSLLHEVENAALLLKGLADACDKDTVVHINVPNANSFHRFLAKNMNLVDDVHEFSERNGQLQQHRVFDIKMLKAEAENAGFSVCDSGSYFLKPFAHAQMFRMMKERIIEENVLDGLYAITDSFQDYGSEIYINAKLK